jgi:hypothetical protein
LCSRCRRCEVSMSVCVSTCLLERVQWFRPCHHRCHMHVRNCPPSGSAAAPC